MVTREDRIVSDILPIGMVSDLGVDWRTMAEEIPVEPRRNVQMLSVDGDGKVFSCLVSSWIASACCAFLWRENDITPDDLLELVKQVDTP